MSIKLITEVWNIAAAMPSGAKFVLLYLANCCNKTNTCWPSISDISSKTSISQRSVKRHLAELKQLDLINITPRNDHNGYRCGSTYSLLIGQNKNNDDTSLSAKLAPMDDSLSANIVSLRAKNARLSAKLAPPIMNRTVKNRKEPNVEIDNSVVENLRCDNNLRSKGISGNLDGLIFEQDEKQSKLYNLLSRYYMPVAVNVPSKLQAMPEIKKYCEEEGLANPDDFIDKMRHHYTNVRKKMSRNWQGEIVTWAMNHKQQTTKQRGKDEVTTDMLKRFGIG